jgi:osmotically-inducible protein OsmY
VTYYGQLDAHDIELEVHDGEVALTGLVDDRQAKRAAERIAEAVYGVHAVHNQLRLRHYAFRH